MSERFTFGVHQSFGCREWIARRDGEVCFEELDEELKEFGLE
jgi:hypothetical protein